MPLKLPGIRWHTQRIQTRLWIGLVRIRWRWPCTPARNAMDLDCGWHEKAQLRLAIAFYAPFSGSVMIDFCAA